MKSVDLTVFDTPRPRRTSRKHGGFPIVREALTADEVKRLRAIVATGGRRVFAAQAHVSVDTLENAMAGTPVTADSAAKLRAFLASGGKP